MRLWKAPGQFLEIRSMNMALQTFNNSIGSRTYRSYSESWVAVQGFPPRAARGGMSARRVLPVCGSCGRPSERFEVRAREGGVRFTCSWCPSLAGL